MKKHNIPYKDLTVERQDLYSESLFYTDSLPHYRTVIINGYCLAYIDGKWKEVTCDFRNPNSTYGYGYDDDGNLEFYEYNDDD